MGFSQDFVRTTIHSKSLFVVFTCIFLIWVVYIFRTSFKKKSSLEQRTQDLLKPSKQPKSPEECLFLKETKGLEEIVNYEERIVLCSDYTTGRRLRAKFPYHCEFIIEAKDGGQHFYDHEQRDDIGDDMSVHWAFYDAETLATSLASIHRRMGRIPLRQREKILSLQAEWQSFLASYMTKDPENPVVVLMPLADYYENVAETMSAPAGGAPIQIFTAKELDRRLIAEADESLTGFVFFEKKPRDTL